MDVVIRPDEEAASLEAAGLVARRVREKPDLVLGLATGSSPERLYGELVRRHREEGLSFAGATSFNLDEYVGLSPEHPASYHRYLREHLLDRLDLPAARAHVPDGEAEDLAAACAAYEQAIADAGGIDVQVLGLGRDGHIGFNEPTSSLGSRTRVKTLTRETVEDNARFFDSPGEVPRHVVTMGVGTIMEAREIVLLAFGAAKARAVREMIEGPIRAMVPASALQRHPRVRIFLDGAAAAELTTREYHEWVDAHRLPAQEL